MTNKIKNTLGGCGRPPTDGTTHNNQPTYSIGDWGIFWDEMRLQKNVWGGSISRRFERQMRRQKIEINTSVRGLWELLDDDFTQQPTKNTRARQRGDKIGRAT